MNRSYTVSSAFVSMARDTCDDVCRPGEEVALDFVSPPHNAPAGVTRRYILEVNGWCKDMDLFTRDGETIAPLPEIAAMTEAARALMRSTRTRPMGGR